MLVIKVIGKENKVNGHGDSLTEKPPNYGSFFSAGIFSIPLVAPYDQNHLGGHSLDSVGRALRPISDFFIPQPLAFWQVLLKNTHIISGLFETL